jgi:CubicO group peptidase (beta-lactamase class C family)
MKMVAELGLRFSGWRPLDQPIIGEADDGNCHYFFGGTAGHAGLFATAQDLCRLGSLYAGSSVLGYLPDELLREAVTDYGNGRGLGFQFGSRYPDGCGHTGFTGSFLYVNPDIKLSLSILTNRLHVPEPQNIDPFREAIVGATLEMTGAK